MENLQELKAGAVVDIFTDPKTCTDLEGEAKLIERIWGATEGRELEYWSVKFINDGFKANRFIKPTTTQPEKTPLTLDLTPEELSTLHGLLLMSRSHIGFDARDLKAYKKVISAVENKLKSKA